MTSDSGSGGRGVMEAGGVAEMFVAVLGPAESAVIVAVAESVVDGGGSASAVVEKGRGEGEISVDII